MFPQVSQAPLYRSPLRYPGGKQKALVQIAAMLPPRVGEYREPMVGGASVYFHAKSIGLASTYWINDKFEELATFWQIIQNPRKCRRLIADLEKLRASFSSPEEIKQYFLKARAEDPGDPYRRALLFFFFNRVTFSGTTRAGGFSSSASTARFTASAIQRLVSMPEALAGTSITNLDFRDVISAAGKNVFLFIDPPYYTSTRLYGQNGDLHRFDHEELAHLLKKTAHRFLITYDDCEQIRKLYKFAKVQNWQLQYGMNNCNRKHASKVGSELFITNYD